MAASGLTLLVFTLMNFVFSMMASVFNGILDMVAVSLGVSVANAGLLNTMYAYGGAFGVPITLILFRKVGRPKLLKIMLLITILTTVALVLAQNFPQMLIVRLIMGLSANSFSVLATATVASLSAKEKLGRSMAILIAGNASALVIGLPLTRALFSLLDWQGIFWILAGMMALALLYFILRLPNGDQAFPNAHIRRELAFFKDGQVVSIIAYALLMFVGVGALQTYITPYLLFVFPAVEAVMTFVLVGLGIASFAGNLLGGHLSDRIGYARSMLLGGLLQTASIALLLLFRAAGWFTVALSILWLMSVWFTGLQLGAGVARVTRNQSSFMLSVNNSAIQLGSAIGSSIASVVISLRGISGIPFITLAACLMIITIQLITTRKDKGFSEARWESDQSI